jgi:biopolymer transport protein ExbD
MSGSSHVAEPALNATPLIDVLLVLLVMLIFTIPIGTHAVKLNLPQAPGTPPPERVNLDIDFDGAVLWNGRPVDAAELDRLCRAAAAAKVVPDVSVIPDRRAPYERVAQVLAAVQRAHLTKLTIAPVPDR